jgi:hypothetical protein
MHGHRWAAPCPHHDRGDEEDVSASSIYKEIA